MLIILLQIMFFFFMENELMYVDNFDANKVFDFLFSLMMLCF
jgi:hypothetical protein